MPTKEGASYCSNSLGAQTSRSDSKKTLALLVRDLQTIPKNHNLLSIRNNLSLVRTNLIRCIEVVPEIENEFLAVGLLLLELSKHAL